MISIHNSTCYFICHSCKNYCQYEINLENTRDYSVGECPWCLEKPAFMTLPFDICGLFSYWQVMFPQYTSEHQCRKLNLWVDIEKINEDEYDEVSSGFYGKLKDKDYELWKKEKNEHFIPYDPSKDNEPREIHDEIKFFPPDPSPSLAQAINVDKDFTGSVLVSSSEGIVDGYDFKDGQIVDKYATSFAKEQTDE